MRYFLPLAIISHIFQLTGVLLLVYSIIKRPHPVRYFLPLFFYTSAYLLTDVMVTISAIYRIHNVIGTYVYYPAEFIFVSWIYISMAPRHHRKLIIILGVIALPIFVATLFFFMGTSGYNFIGMSIVHFALLIIAGRFLVWLTAKGQTELKVDPQFYVTLGIILDCGITAISYILFDTFEYRMPYYFNALSDTVSSIFVFTGILFLFKNEMAVLKILREADRESLTT